MIPIMMNYLPQKENRLLLLFSLFVVLVNLIPYFYGYAISDDQHIFFGSVSYVPEDTAWHLSFAKQVQHEGHFLLENKYTGAEATSRIYLNLYAIVMGELAAISGLSLITLWHVQRVVVTILLVWVTFHFLSLFQEDKRFKWISMVLIFFSSGAYWINNFKNPASLQSPYYIETSIFSCLQYEVYIPLTLVLILLMIINLYKALAQGGRKPILIAGCLTVLTSMVHPLSSVLICWITGTYFVYLAIFPDNRMPRKHVLTTFILFYAVLAPMVAYGIFLMLMAPDMRGYPMIVDPIEVSSLLIHYGVLLPIAVIGILMAVRKPPFYLVGLWLVIALVLLFIPLPFMGQIYLMDGLNIPIAVLGAHVWVRLWDRWRTSPIRLSICLIGFLLYFASAITTNVIQYTYNFKSLSKKEFPHFFKAQTVEALNYLSLNTTPDQVILSPFRMKLMIPFLTGNRSYTKIDCFEPGGIEKDDKVFWFFYQTKNKTSATLRAFLSRNRIAYIFLGDYKRPYDPPVQKKSLRKLLNGMSGIQEVFADQGVYIYKVNLKQPQRS